MQKEIEINNQKINYTLRKSRRARRMRLTIGCDGNLTVTLPNSLFFGEHSAEKAIREKAEWILDKLAYFQKHKSKYFFRSTRSEFLKHKKVALELAIWRIKYFNSFYKFQFNRISIRNQKTRWGSCSRKGNLNFNYKIALLPEKIADYIIVHELCHLGEFNHSKKFWDLVSKTISDYKGIRREIRGA
jgi:predicted metal-dependent hydrolase